MWRGETTLLLLTLKPGVKGEKSLYQWLNSAGMGQNTVSSPLVGVLPPQVGVPVPPKSVPAP